MSAEARVPSYSALAKFSQCPRAYQYYYERRLEPKGAAVAAPLAAGAAGHAGLLSLYTQGWDVEKAKVAAAEEWEARGAPVDPRAPHLTLAHIHGALEWYVKEREAEEWEVVEHPSGRPWAEVLHEFELRNGLRYTGVVDLVVRISGTLYIVDHKWTSQWVTGFWADAIGQVFHQGRGYMIGVEQALGVPCAGVIVNGVHMGPSATAPPEVWATRKSSRSRAFGPYTFGPEHLRETEQWVSARLVQIQQMREARLQEWPQNDQARCEWCEFLPLCKASPGMREALVRRDYQVRVERAERSQEGTEE